MNKLAASIFVSLTVLAASASAQIVLDTFNSGATGSVTLPPPPTPPDPWGVRAGTSWVGNITQNSTTITIGGTAKDDNGWGVTGLNLNATGLTNLFVTAQLEAGNAATSFTIQFEDAALSTQVFSVSSTAFTVGSMTTVNIPVAFNLRAFDAAHISGWNIGGGSTGILAFNFTFDNLLLSVPEPSTYALLALGLGVVLVPVLRRRRR